MIQFDQYFSDGLKPSKSFLPFRIIPPVEHAKAPKSEAQADGFIDPGECKGKLEFDQVCFHYATRRKLRLEMKLLKFWRELKVGKPLV